MRTAISITGNLTTSLSVTTSTPAKVNVLKHCRVCDSMGSYRGPQSLNNG